MIITLVRVAVLARILAIVAHDGIAALMMVPYLA